jgi:CO/xanthine dehydrogenase FAD-binding subunit
VDVLLPETLEEALSLKAATPGAVPIAGGTDVMVGLNVDGARPEAIIDLTRLRELQRLERRDGAVFLGAGVSYTRIMRELPDQVALAQASRSVGSPQIRNRGTVGGNLGTASPAGDALPVLAAYEADVVLAGPGGRTRSVPVGGFLVGHRRTALEPDELILGATWHEARGPGSFSKVGPRNAMVIAVCSVCVQLDEDARTVRVALGSVGPTVLRAHQAEAFAAGAMEASGAWEEPGVTIADDEVERFGDLAGAAATPIDDVRGSAAYRRHAVGVLARRGLRWALADRRGGI